MNYSIKKIILNDWPALTSAVGIPIIWGIHYAFPYLRPGAVHLPSWLPLLISAAFALTLADRISHIARLFEHGIPARAVVTGLRIVRDRGRLEFAFEYDGRRFASWMPVHKTEQVMTLIPGTAIEVLFNREKPEQAIVKSLFEA